MNPKFKSPPENPVSLSSLEQLKLRLEPLIGAEFKITKKSRTDGSNNRKLIAAQLLKFELPNPAIKNTFEIVTPCLLYTSPSPRD